MTAPLHRGGTPNYGAIERQESDPKRKDSETGLISEPTTKDKMKAIGQQALSSLKSFWKKSDQSDKKEI